MKSEWVGQRMAEFQFGRNIMGWFQFLFQVVIIIKLFDLSQILYVLVIPVGVLCVWILGFICYKFSIVRHFREKEFSNTRMMQSTTTPTGRGL